MDEKITHDQIVVNYNRMAVNYNRVTEQLDKMLNRIISLENRLDGLEGHDGILVMSPEEVNSIMHDTYRGACALCMPSYEGTVEAERLMGFIVQLALLNEGHFDRIFNQPEKMLSWWEDVSYVKFDYNKLPDNLTEDLTTIGIKKETIKVLSVGDLWSICSASLSLRRLNEVDDG